MIEQPLRKLFYAAAALALLTGGAAAQSNPFMPKMSLEGPSKHKTPEEKEKEEALDKAYQAATKKIPDQKVADPWATVRPTPEPAAPKQTASKQTAQKQTAAQTKKPQ